MKAALYVRVSTSDQNCTLQLSDLEHFVGRMGWECAGIYQDSMSGSKASRPGLDRMMSDARLRKFDAVVVWKLDRFGRSLVHCVSQIQELSSLGIRFVAITQGLDTDTANPTSSLLLHILAAVAQFERELARERVAAGMRTASVRGTRSGKPIGRPKRIFDRSEALRLRAEGWPLQRIADSLGVGLGTIARTLTNQSEQIFQKASA